MIVSANPITPARTERYHVAWREPNGSEATGSLQLEHSRLALQGRRTGGEEARASLSYAELTGVRIGRSAGETLRGRPTIILEHNGRSALAVAPLGAGLLSELADLLATVAATYPDSAEQVAVVVPLRRGSRDRARALIEEGPPFEVQGSGLVRHHVFLGESEAVFVFEGRDVRRTVERLLRKGPLLGAAIAWRDVLAGRPRFVESLYAWTDDESS